jgi:hypothetical protein
MLIDCNQCAMQHTSACDDCLVTFLLDSGPLEIDDAESEALANLADGGLVPRLRLIPADRRAG